MMIKAVVSNTKEGLWEVKETTQWTKHVAMYFLTYPICFGRLSVFADSQIIVEWGGHAKSYPLPYPFLLFFFFKVFLVLFIFSLPFA